MGKDFIMSTEITQVRNAASLNEENTMFDVEINHPDYGWVPYFLDPDDTDDDVSNEALLSLIGSDYAAYIAPTQEELDAVAASEVRREREFKLVNHVDPIVSNPLRWNDMTPEQQGAWSQYRTDLLNITDQSGFPHSVNWPTSP
jgi:hypothetical protein